MLNIVNDDDGESGCDDNKLNDHFKTILENDVLQTSFFYFLKCGHLLP